MQGRLAWIDSAAEIAYFAGLLLVGPLLVGLACAILIDGWQRLCSWLGWKRWEHEQAKNDNIADTRLAAILAPQWASKAYYWASKAPSQ